MKVLTSLLMQTPNGKYLQFFFFIFAINRTRLLLDCIPVMDESILDNLELRLTEQRKLHCRFKVDRSNYW